MERFGFVNKNCLIIQSKCASGETVLTLREKTEAPQQTHPPQQPISKLNQQKPKTTTNQPNQKTKRDTSDE
ncbi:MAG: hypothetical protein LBC03_06595 [Nitrososphaerota archaeon]|nr:hypothetical protein [Nitrososphaerota archaeon]